MKNLKLCIPLFAFVIFLANNLYSQTISLDEAITKDTIINLEAKFNGTCNTFKVNSEINFLSDSGLVRIVMQDDHGLRHLVFESYPTYYSR